MRAGGKGEHGLLYQKAVDQLGKKKNDDAVRNVFSVGEGCGKIKARAVDDGSRFFFWL